MNRIIRSRVRGLVIVLLLSLFLMGCDQCSQCMFICMILPPTTDFVSCLFVCTFMTPYCRPENWMQTLDECAATFEQMQTAAIEYCEASPEQCQEYFDSWVETLEEAEE